MTELQQQSVGSSKRLFFLVRISRINNIFPASPIRDGVHRPLMSRAHAQTEPPLPHRKHVCVQTISHVSGKEKQKEKPKYLLLYFVVVLFFFLPICFEREESTQLRREKRCSTVEKPPAGRKKSSNGRLMQMMAAVII